MLQGRGNRAAILLGILVLHVSAIGMVFLETPDPSHNTTPPDGALADSGWQHQGDWAQFLGTAIGPRHFITAGHLGGQVGQAFRLGGRDYQATAVYDDPLTDLRIWRICGILEDYAALYAGAAEAGQALVVFGRGRARGAPVFLGEPLPENLRGWAWGDDDRVRRWGENAVVEVVDGDAVTGQGGVGELLRATFDAGAGPNECHLAGGDSGGGLFIREDGIWKLAGINYAVEGPYRIDPSGASFSAAVFDQGGLYAQEFEGTNWVQIPVGPEPQPGAFYATRIAARLDWINGVLAQPVPPAEQIVVESTRDLLSEPFTPATATVDEWTRTISVPRPDSPRFYRIRFCAALRLTGQRVEGNQLLLTFE